MMKRRRGSTLKRRRRSKIKDRPPDASETRENEQMSSSIECSSPDSSRSTPSLVASLASSSEMPSRQQTRAAFDKVLDDALRRQGIDAEVQRSTMRYLQERERLYTLTTNDIVRCQMNSNDAIVDSEDDEYSREQIQLTNDSIYLISKTVLKHRAMQIRWINDWCDDYTYCDHTREYAVSLFDRYSASVQFAHRHHRATTLAACLWIAVKTQEVHCSVFFNDLLDYGLEPEHSDRRNILDAEFNVLLCVNCEIIVPVVHDFLGYYLYACDSVQRFFSEVACDLAIGEDIVEHTEPLWQQRPSLLAAAAVYFALEICPPCDDYRDDDKKATYSTVQLPVCDYSPSDQITRSLVGRLRRHTHRVLALARADERHRFGSGDGTSQVLVRRCRRETFAQLMKTDNERMISALDRLGGLVDQ